MEMLYDSNSEAALLAAEELIEKATVEPDKLLTSINCNYSEQWKSLQQKLLDVYVEAAHRQPTCQNVRIASNLLSQLINKERFNTLVVNLYPGNEGFSLMLRGQNGVDSETIRLPYEETELLEYIDTEKLPPLLVDLFDRAQSNLFHCGCVVAEVRDYRRSTNNLYETQYVLLQPSIHTLVCDMNAMTCDSQWTVEDKLQLESELLLATSEPLCLDPSTTVYHLTAQLNYQKHKLNTQSLRRCARRCSQAAVNRRRKLSLCCAPKHLRLFDFVKHRKNKNKNTVNLRLASVSCVDTWKRTDVQLATPDNIDVQKYAKAIDRPQLTGDNSPVVVEEYIFETERRDGRVNMSRLVIMQRLSDESYLGTLYVDRDFRDVDSKGNACRFILGTKAHVEKYVRQFREIFTEEGRRQVKITHQVPGRPPTVTYTQVSQSTAQSAAQTPTTQTVSGATQDSVTAVSRVSAGVNVSQTAVGRVSAGVNVSQVVSQSTIQQLSGELKLSVASGGRLSLSNTSAINSLPYANMSRLPSNNSNLAQTQLRLALQQQQQQQQQKSLSGLSPTAVAMPTYNLVASQHSSSTQHATAMSTQLKSPGLIRNVAPTTSHMDSNVDGAAQVWNSSTSSLHIGSLSSVAPPNVNIGTIGTLPPNVNIQNLSRLQLHQPQAIQMSPGQPSQRSFVAMVTSPGTFIGSPPHTPLLSSPTGRMHPTSPLFSAPVNRTQFSVVPAARNGSVPLSPVAGSPLHGGGRPAGSPLHGVGRPAAGSPLDVRVPIRPQMLHLTQPSRSRLLSTDMMHQSGPSGLTSPTMVSQFRIQHQPMSSGPVAMQQVSPSGIIQQQQQQQQQQLQLQLQNTRQTTTTLTNRRPSSGKPPL